MNPTGVKILSKTRLFDICNLYIFLHDDTPDILHVVLTDDFSRFTDVNKTFIGCVTTIIRGKMQYTGMSVETLLEIDKLIEVVKTEYINAQMTSHNPNLLPYSGAMT